MLARQRSSGQEQRVWQIVSGAHSAKAQIDADGHTSWAVHQVVVGIVEPGPSDADMDDAEAMSVIELRAHFEKELRTRFEKELRGQRLYKEDGSYACAIAPDAVLRGTRRVFVDLVGEYRAGEVVLVSEEDPPAVIHWSAAKIASDSGKITVKELKRTTLTVAGPTRVPKK